MVGDQAGDTHTTEMFGGVSRQNSVRPNNQTCIPVKEVEILGPDYCSKRPVFLPLHFPDMIVNSPTNMQQ